MVEIVDRGNVVVYGTDVRKPPLLDSTEANLIVIHDGFGDPMVLFTRILTNDTWGMVTKADSDWDQMLARYGVRRSTESAAGYEKDKSND